MTTLLRCITSLLAAAFLGGCGGDGPVPLPEVEQVQAAGAPFNATTLALQASGYVEEEFYVRGRAGRYRIADPMATAEPIDAGHAYATRVLVRRPTTAARFNGTVVVEWLNVTTGQDIDFVFGATRELLLREGYAWVGVSAQRAGLQTLQQWNPGRYGALSVAASNVDPATGTEIDPARFPSIGGDVLAWDVFSQVGASIASPGSRLLGGLRARRIIAAGESQSASRLTSYYNSIQPLHRVYDGFLLYDRGGPVRSDLGVKLVGIGTEFTVSFTGRSAAPDTADHRWWEIAGASHVSLAEMGYLDPVIARDGALRAPDGTALSLSDAVNGGSCTVTPIWSRVPNADIVKAGLEALQRWMSGGAAPASVPRMVLSSSGQLQRDTDGRVQGGVRTAAYEEPVATNVGVNTGGGFCMLAGYHLDFSPAALCARHGSRQAYVASVLAQTQANVNGGLLLPAEAERTVEEAQAVAFACPA
jgi:alpha/beta hydrolase family protein